jgi:hypothetical protein
VIFPRLQGDSNKHLYGLVAPGLAVVDGVHIRKPDLVTGAEVHYGQLYPEACNAAPLPVLIQVTIVLQAVHGLFEQCAIGWSYLELYPFALPEVDVEQNRDLEVAELCLALASVAKQVVVNIIWIVAELGGGLHKIHLGLYAEPVAEIKLQESAGLEVEFKTTAVRPAFYFVDVHAALGTKAEKVLLVAVGTVALGKTAEAKEGKENEEDLLHEDV